MNETKYEIKRCHCTALFFTTGQGWTGDWPVAKDGYFLVLCMVKVSCIQGYYISAHIKRRYAEFLLVDMPLFESDNFKVSVLISKYISKESHTNKLEVLNQCWFNVGPPSMTLVQHWTNIGSMYLVCLVLPTLPTDWSILWSWPIRRLDLGEANRQCVMWRYVLSRQRWIYLSLQTAEQD